MNMYNDPLLGGFFIIITLFGIILLALCILSIIVTWKLFKKAGEHGYWALIPFANSYHLFKIAWGNGRLFWFMFLPVGNIIMLMATYYKLAKSFGKDTGFAIATMFLSLIFLCILAFSKEETYKGPQPDNKKPIIIATSVIGGLYLFIIMFTFIIVGIILYNTNPTSYTTDTSNWNYAQPIENETESQLEINTKSETSGIFKNVTLNNKKVTVDVPMFNNDTTYATDTMASSVQDGVSISATLEYSEKYQDLADYVKDEIETTKQSYDGLEFYQNITVDELYSGTDYALQQINYDYIIADKAYHCFTIVKADIINGYPVISNISVDNSITTENTKSILKTVCDEYGIQFDFD